MKWVRVRRNEPCTICEHPSWCSISEDGTVAVCMRVESSKPCKSGGWFHDLGEPVARPRRLQRKPRPVPIQDFPRLACQYVEQLTNIALLAESLGVTVRSLERLQVGWNGKGYTFPMRDGREKIIGIRIRGHRGKWCIPGSHNGLFWPEGVYSGSDTLLIICEGATDCAALLDLAYDAIGRPSCLGGVEHVVEFLKGRRRDVIIMADHDSPKRRPDGSVWFPGIEGARQLSTAIRPLVRTLKIIKPPFHKDVRAWRMAGATRDVVNSIIKNTRFVA